MGIICVLWAAKDREIFPFFLNADGFYTFLRHIPIDQKTDLDKSWHAIHFLLSRCDNNSSQYASFLLSGGHRFPVPIEKPAPTRAFLSSEVKDIADMLASITDEMLISGYQPSLMNQSGIYPYGWTDFNGENVSFRQYLIDNF